MSFFFKALLTGQPEDAHTITIYEAGTATPVDASNLTALDGTPLTNPFTVAAAGGKGFWGFRHLLADEIDIYWNEGAETLALNQTTEHEYFNIIKINPMATAPVSPEKGDMWWNADEDTVNLSLNGATLQLGQELHYHVRNNSGADIGDGIPVMATGTIGASGRITIGLMDGTDAENAKFFLGVTTETISNGADGKVTYFGKVRNIDTSSFSDEDVLWISSTVAGEFTATQPSPPAIGLAIAIVINSHVSSGTIFVRATNSDENHFVPWAVLQDWKDPIGFVDNANVTVTGDKTTRTVTLTGDLSYRYNGFDKLLGDGATWTSPAHDAADGVYFLKSTDGTNFAWSTTVWNFYDVHVAVAVVLNSGADIFYIREPHGLMPWSVHEELHSRLGTYRESGLGVTAGTYTLDTATDAATTPGFDAGVIKDEDIKTAIAATTDGSYTTFRIGAGSVPTFDTAATFPFRSSGSFPLVNDPSDGSETAALNNRFINVYELLLPASADADSQKYRRLMVQPQAEYLTQDLAEEENFGSLSLGLLGSPEFVPYTRLTYKTNSGDLNTGKCRLVSVTTITGSRENPINVGNIVIPNQALGFACSDLTSALAVGTSKGYLPLPYDFNISDVQANVLTAPTGANIIVDINSGGASILSTLITIEAGETSSTTAATPPVVSSPAQLRAAQITADIDQVGSTVAGVGLVVFLIGKPA